MKKFRLFSTLTLLAITLTLFANEPKHEFRATWLATVTSIDWPKTKAKDNASRAQQQKELTDILDKLQAGNMNACYLQVRSLCDAMHKSSYEPWSAALTDTRGKDPGYDPLAFAIEEAHKRGMELHIWVNPFRVTSSGTVSTSDLTWQNAGQWIIKYDNGSFSGQIIDPGYPQARAYVIKVLMEIINNYDVDGIVMDDYFYPYGSTTTEDAASKALYKPANVVDVNQDGKTDDDWRRMNVDDCIKVLYDSLQATKPWVRFGMGTFGIWTTQKKAAQAYGISLPSGITGLDDYDVQACNPVEWVKYGYVDYINPQLYWSRDYAGQSYDVLCEWWAKDVCEHFSNQLPNGKKVHFCVSQAAYHAYDGYKGYDDGVGEIQDQIDVNRANLSSGYNGSVFYNTTAYCKMYQELQASHFNHKALMPAMDWKVTEQLSAPENLRVENNILKWEHPIAERFTVYAYPKGMVKEVAMNDSQYLLQMVYGKSINLSSVSNLSEKTIAVCAYDRFGVEHGVALYNEGDAPILPPTQEADSITWVLNGGEVPTVEVPSHSELWNMLKPDYVAFYQDMYGSQFVAAEDRTMDDVLGFTWINSMGKGLAADFMTKHTNWTWLRDYMLNVADGDGYVISTDNDWRYHLYSFFNCTDAAYRTDGYRAGSTANFTNAGKPEVWGVAYQVAHGGVVLPSSVSETFVLPIPTHPEGLTFYGWYSNPDFEGTPLVEIPAGWTGTLYACWTEPATVESIEWELNGGRVPADVPTNDSLWTAFKPYYNEYYNDARADQPIDKVATFAASKMQEIMTDPESKYKWLGDYVLSVAELQSYSLSTDMSNADEKSWRWHVHAFFNCNDGTVQGNQKVATADYSVAGQPSSWGSAYQSEYDAVLPSHISEEYELPIPVKEGNIFWGWYDNKSYQGTALTHIPANWTGTLYAKWYETTTDIAVNEAVEPIKVYDVFGRYVGNSTSHLSHGLYVIVQGNKTTKIIL